MILLSYFLQAGLSAAAYTAIFFAWWRLLKSRGVPEDYGELFQLLLAATLMWSQIFCVVLVLGLLGVLDRSLVLAINAGITAFLLVVTRKPSRSTPGLFVLIGRRACVILSAKPRDGLLLVLVGIGAFAVAWFTILNIAFPSGGYDDFVYHIPSAALYLQQHSICILPVGPVQESINTAAKFGELFSVFQFSLLGNDHMIHFWAIPMFVHYLLSAYALCRQLGVAQRNALFGSLFSAFAPTLMCQTLTAYDDLPMAGLFAPALSFAVNRARGRAQRIATALSCGLLLSSKLSAILLCGVSLLCFTIAELQANRTAWLNGLRMGFAIAVLAFALGGYWYVRNTSEYHNPFYPYQVKIAALKLPGHVTVRNEMLMLNPELTQLTLPLRLWRLWREEKSHFGLWLYNYDSAYAGFGPLFFVLGIPSFVASIGISILDRRSLTLSVLALTAFAYLGFSGNISPRLSLFILPVIGLAIAIVLTAMEQDWPWNRFRGLSLSVKATGCFLACFTFLAVGAAPYAPAVLRAQLISAPADKDSIQGTFWNRFAKLRQAIPAHAHITYDENQAFIWPLWRPDWSNEVRFIPTTGGWEHWRGNAQKLGITHVAVGPNQPSPLSSWVAQHPDKFKPLAQSGFGSLYGYRE